MNHKNSIIRLDILGQKYKNLIETNQECVLEDNDEEELLTYLDSRDEIIRAGAVDLLAYSSRSTTRDALMHLLKNDKSRIVRAYCCSSLCDIAFERKENNYIIPFLLKAFEKEHCIYVQLAWISDLASYSNLAELDEYKRIIIKGLHHSNRHYRYLAVKAILSDPRLIDKFDYNCLLELAHKEKRRYILLEMQEVLKQKRTVKDQ